MAPLRIDSSRIADEALRLLRAGGLEAVSLRRIAAGLGVGTSTLYWHIRNKDDLLVALAARLFRECLDEIGAQEDWRGWLRAFGLALWQAQVEISDVHKLILLARPDVDRHRALTAEITQTLRALGLAEADAAVAQRSVQALVTGWTTLAPAGVSSGGDERARFGRALEALIAGWQPAPPAGRGAVPAGAGDQPSSGS